MGIEMGRLLTAKAPGSWTKAVSPAKEVSMAKVQVSEARCTQAMTRTIQLCGARVYSKDTPLEWMYRYARQRVVTVPRRSIRWCSRRLPLRGPEF